MPTRRRPRLFMSALSACLPFLLISLLDAARSATPISESTPSAPASLLRRYHPAPSARHNSSRMVRASTRGVSPSREISPAVGSTHHAPMRSIAGTIQRFQHDSESFRPNSGVLDLFVGIVSKRVPHQRREFCRQKKRTTAIAVGGLAAGALDLTQASVLFASWVSS